MIKKILLFFAISFSICVTQAQLDIEHYLGVGRTELYQDNYQAAIDRFNAVIKVKPGLADAYFYRGIAKYNLSDFLGSLNDFNRTIELNPYFSDAYHFRGIARARLNDFKDAMDDFALSVELNPTNPHAYISRGITYLMLEKNDEAISDFNQSIFLRGNIPDAYMNRGMAKLQKKDIKPAIEDFSKAIQMNPYFSEAFVRRAYAFAEDSNFNAAMADFSQAIKLSPKNSLLYFNRAYLKYRFKDVEGAIDDYNKVIELDPKNALTFFNRAVLYSEIGKYDEAIADYGKTIALSPGNVLPFYNRAAVKFETGDYRGAIRDYGSAIEIFPDFASAYINRAAAYRKLNLNKEANYDYIVAKEKIARYKKNTSDTTGLQFMDTSYNFRRIIEFDTEFEYGYNPEIHLQYKKIAIEPFPNFAFLWQKGNDSDFINRKIALHDPQLLCNLYEYSVRLKPDTSAIGNSFIEMIEKSDSFTHQSNQNDQLYLQALTGNQTGNYNKALGQIDQFIKEQPEKWYGYFTRANIRNHMLEFILSVDDFNTTIKVEGNRTNYSEGVNPDDFLADYQKSVDDYSRAIELKPGFEYIWFNRANTKIRMKNFTSAIDDYSKSIEIAPDFSEAYFNRGLCLLYLKDKDKGCADMSKAGELGIAGAYPVIKKYCSKKE